VLDTAGIRETQDKVEKIGVERSRAAAKQADLVLLTIDAESGWTEEDSEIYEQVKHRQLIIIINKIDLVKIIPELPFSSEIHPIVAAAAALDRGIADLETAILDAVSGGTLQAANSDLAINQRQAAALTRAKISLEQCTDTISNKLPLDFWTIDLRGAIQALGEVTGEEVTESVLDRIFSRFCIGK
jgi:tRNA modification GTPase